jgi:RNA polymerase sigma-70 factor (ECF subfamily)
MGGSGAVTDGDEGYAEHRPLLFSLAYRMTGSVSEAEDIVQEAFARLARARRGGTSVREPKAYLARTATRLALNHLRSARLRRESYLGTWLPEPVLTGPGPEEHAEVADSLSMAFLVVLESLSPAERAVFLLHEVFDYEHREIAEMTGTSTANSRQILARARQRVDEGKPRFEASRAQREEVARRFFAAADGGDLDGLLRALAPDAVYYGDGGGHARAVGAPVHGRDRVARFLTGLFRRIRKLEAGVRIVEANGQPGAVTYDREGQVVNVFALDIADGVVQAIRCVVNPDKLGHLGHVSHLARELSPYPARMSDRYRLQRFVDAQDAGGTYARAVRELRTGRKASHWMWFVFPQIAGLGYSSISREYAISGRTEAAAYLAHPVLGPRLVECAQILTAHAGTSAVDIFGAVDAMKLRSSMTLFASVAEPGGGTFREVLDLFFGGVRDEATTSRLTSDGDRAAEPGPGEH